MRISSPSPYLLLLMLISGCGKHHSTDPGAVAAAKLAACDTANWLGLPDSISCPRVGASCEIPGNGKVATNVCGVDDKAYAYSVIKDVAFATEAKATLNGTQVLTGEGTGLLIFGNLQAQNELVFRIEYKNNLNDPSPTVYTKTYTFKGN